MNKNWAKEAVAEIIKRCTEFETPEGFNEEVAVIYDVKLAKEIILAHAAPILAENRELKKKIKKLEDEMEEIKEAGSVNF